MGKRPRGFGSPVSESCSDQSEGVPSVGEESVHEAYAFPVSSSPVAPVAALFPQSPSVGGESSAGASSSVPVPHDSLIELVAQVVGDERNVDLGRELERCFDQ